MARKMLSTEPIPKIHSNRKFCQEIEASQSAKKDVIKIGKITLMSNLDRSAG